MPKDSSNAQPEARKSGEPIALTYRFGEFTLDLARGCVLKAGEEIRLRPKVYEALKYLVQNPNRLVGKEELIQAVWPDSFVTDDSLVQCALELRRALGDRDQQLIKTVPRRGYLFTAEVIQSGAGGGFASDSGSIGSREGRARIGKPGRGPIDLPTPRTSLIGRERAVAEAARFLLKPSVRLVSATGPGGSGKTRLAIAVAAFFRFSSVSALAALLIAATSYDSFHYSAGDLCRGPLYLLLWPFLFALFGNETLRDRGKNVVIGIVSALSILSDWGFALFVLALFMLHPEV